VDARYDQFLMILSVHSSGFDFGCSPAQKAVARLRKINRSISMPSPETALRNISAVVITGGSSGIGKSFIELCGRLRPELAFCNLSRRKPDTGNSQLKLRHVPCDLSDSAQVERGIAAVANFLAVDAPTGRILLINNSGFGIYGYFPEPGAAQQAEMIDVNVRAVVQMTAALLPTLKARGGVIVTIASTSAFQPTPFLATYGASKAFVLHWSLALNEELRGTGVSTLAVCPGPTSTDFFVRAGLEKDAVPDMFGETTEKVVLASLSAIASGKSMVVSGWKNKLLAAFATKFPKPTVARLAGISLRHFRMKRVKP
jgi:short-subunit dehydrogenase